MDAAAPIWIGFIAFVLLMLLVDLGVFHRKAHAVGIRESLVWSGVWIALALLFSVFVHLAYDRHWMGLGTHASSLHPAGLDGSSAAVLYLTGYLVEKSLSVDNLFVFSLIFTAFSIPAIYQHRVLFWGIIGALVLRGAMIAAGTALVERFHWILYLFGVFLIFTAIHMLLKKDQPRSPEDNRIVRFAQRRLPVTARLYNQHFLIRRDKLAPDDPAREHVASGKWFLTPLALTLVVVESSDIVFAVDSIPAIFAITTDPFLVFTSNVFAILGLRALYFALSGTVARFYYLQYALAVILAIVGIKMLVADQLRQWIGDALSFYMLGIIVVVMGVGVAASIIRRHRRNEK